MTGRLARLRDTPRALEGVPTPSRESAVHPILRRSVQAVVITGGLAAIALELVGAAAALAMTVVAAMAGPVAGRRLRWPPGRGPSALTEVPTQRPATPRS